jgi:hypothetical protein
MYPVRTRGGTYKVLKTVTLHSRHSRKSRFASSLFNALRWNVSDLRLTLSSHPVLCALCSVLRTTRDLDEPSRALSDSDAGTGGHAKKTKH